MSLVATQCGPDEKGAATVNDLMPLVVLGVEYGWKKPVTILSANFVANGQANLK